MRLFASLSPRTRAPITPTPPKRKPTINWRCPQLPSQKLLIDLLSSLLHLCLQNPLQSGNLMLYIQSILRICKMTVGGNFNSASIWPKRGILTESFQLEIKALFQTLTFVICCLTSTMRTTVRI